MMAGPTLEAFAEFCESKPADEGYSYLWTHACACGQFADSLNVSWLMPWLHNNPFWNKADNISSKFPHTFGALAWRLREASIAQKRLSE
jgi:hypothetical protein